jgi:putative DNA primase/helicase
MPAPVNGLPPIVPAALEHGWSIVPCGPDKKALVEWAPLQTTRPTLERVQRWHAELHPAAYAVVTGKISGVAVADFDGAAGQETMRKYGIRPHVRSGSGGGHEYLEYPGFHVPTWNGKQKTALQKILPGTDLKGDGGYAIFWGRNANGAYKRLRPLGKPDPWAGELVDVLMVLLERAGTGHGSGRHSDSSPGIEERVPADEILAVYLRRECNGAGRNDTGFDLAVQLRDNDYSEEEATAVMLEYAAAVKTVNTKGHPELYSEEEVRATLRSVYGRPRRNPWVPHGYAGRVAGTNEAANAEQRADQQARAGDEWPQPEPLGEALPPVLPFDERLLPAALRPLVVDVAERMQVPMDFPAAAVMLCLAGAVNRRALVQPKDGDPSWVVVPNLWGAVIGPPGYMKTPALQAPTRILNRIQACWRSEHADAMRQYTQAKEEFDLRLTAWKEEFKKAVKKGRPAPARPPGEPEKPQLRRLLVNDATCEAMHETMAANPAGILVVRDELTGWLAQLDKPGREGERAFCLQAWNGDTPFTLDRIGRGTTHVPNCCMSMVGGITPGRLRSYLADALQDGPTNDGLIQRFQVMVWPDTEQEWAPVNKPANKSAEAAAESIFRQVIELDVENPRRFFFEMDAQELFWAWLAELEAKVRGNDLHPALTSHLAKYRSFMPSLALLTCVADKPDGDAISLDDARRAAAFCEYCESHARRVYSCVITPQMRAAHELAGKIRQHKVGASGVFSCRRDVYLKGWAGLTSPELVKQAAEVCEDANWIRRLVDQQNPAGGRPPDRYAINPRLWR